MDGLLGAISSGPLGLFPALDYSVLSIVRWPLVGVGFLLFVLVMAFNMFADALQDAFDPKKVG